MKKWVMILIFCAMLTGCGNSDKEAMTVTTEVIHETVTTTTAASVSETTTNPNTEETKRSAEKTDATAGKTSTSKTTKRSVTTARETGTTTRSVTESIVSSQTEPERFIETEMPKTTAEIKQTTAAKPAVTTTTRSTTTTTTTTMTTTTAKPKQSVSEKPKPKETTTTTTTTAKPVETTAASKSKDELYAEEYWEIIDRKGLNGKDGTCLETMVLNLKYSDTPPSYYENIGKGLKHDGTDYGKAVAVYKWMRANGWGSCVYYSMETYFVCKGIGLECAYAFATKNDWYGHTYNVVKVNGTWFVLDTQGKSFLESSEYCTRMFDGNDNDLTPFKDDIWYDYDENGKYRNWTISD